MKKTENKDNNEKEKKEKKQYKENKKEGNKKEENKGDKEEEKKNKENKEQNNNKENKNEVIITKNGKLKKGLKYKVDFIILYDELYIIIKNSYSLNYEIRLKKIKFLYLEAKKKKEEKKD